MVLARKLLLLMLAVAPAALTAQGSNDLPIPGYPTAHEVPNAHELPDPDLTYKLLFVVTKGAAKDDEVNPSLSDLASLVNTMAKYGVPASHRKFVVVIYGDATPIILDDATYKAQHGGHANPDLTLMRALAKAGVELHVCGQAVYYHKVDPKTIQPEVQVDLAAWTTIANYEMRGYQKLGD